MNVWGVFVIAVQHHRCNQEVKLNLKYNQGLFNIGWLLHPFRACPASAGGWGHKKTPGEPGVGIETKTNNYSFA